MVWIYTLISVVIVSLISLIGIGTFSIDRKKLEQALIYFVSLSTGTLLGDAFIHLIPESFKNNKSSLSVSLFILSGILTFFVLEKFVHWRHCHEIASPDHPHPFSYVFLLGDGVHNFIDGMIIAASFLVSIPLGIATATAVIFHEIPEEIGNFGSLLYGGFSWSKALFYNFLTGIASIAGAILVLLASFDPAQATNFLIPFAAGGFIYVASADLIPELHKHTEIKKSFGQLVIFLLGIGMMVALRFVFE